MLDEFRESAKLAKVTRDLIRQQIDEVITRITPQTSANDRMEIIEQLADIYAKLSRAMETTWKGLVAKDGSITEKDPSLQELLDLAKRG
jgi:hypothetical protein